MSGENAWQGRKARTSPTATGDSGKENICELVGYSEEADFPFLDGFTVQDVSRAKYTMELELLHADSYCLPMKELITKTMERDPLVKRLMFNPFAVDAVIDYMAKKGTCERTMVEQTNGKFVYVAALTQKYFEGLGGDKERFKHLGENAEARINSGMPKAI